MSINLYKPHVWLVPEDDADRQLAVGFLDHHAVDDAQVKRVPPVGGWRAALAELRDVYVPKLLAYPGARVVILIDFDGDYEDRRRRFAEAVPEPLRARAFVLGARGEPEDLRRALRMSYAAIGAALADECQRGATALWSHDQLRHNAPDLEALAATVRPILLPA